MWFISFLKYFFLGIYFFSHFRRVRKLFRCFIWWRGWYKKMDLFFVRGRIKKLSTFELIAVNSNYFDRFRCSLPNLSDNEIWFFFSIFIWVNVLKNSRWWKIFLEDSTIFVQLLDLLLYGMFFFPFLNRLFIYLSFLYWKFVGIEVFF